MQSIHILKAFFKTGPLLTTTFNTLMTHNQVYVFIPWKVMTFYSGAGTKLICDWHYCLSPPGLRGRISPLVCAWSLHVLPQRILVSSQSLNMDCRLIAVSTLPLVCNWVCEFLCHLMGWRPVHCFTPSSSLGQAPGRLRPEIRISTTARITVRTSVMDN